MTKEYVRQLSYEIVGFAINVHRALGPGLLESVYERCLKYELDSKGYEVRQQLTVDVKYQDLILATPLKVDLLVESCVVVELKAVEELLPVHEAQVLTYMKLLKVPQGLLINFHSKNITKSFKPFVNEYYSLLKDSKCS